MGGRGIPGLPGNGRRAARLRRQVRDRDPRSPSCRWPVTVVLRVQGEGRRPAIDRMSWVGSAETEGPVARLAFARFVT